MLAYLLLMSLRTSIKIQTGLVEVFRQDDENNYLLIESLLYCGTRCSCKSIISHEAFKILDIVFNGSISLNIDPWMLLEEDKTKLDFYSKYADNFVFDAINVTSQMINALPIFWNHQYNIESYIRSKEEKKSIDVFDYYPNNNGKVHREALRKKGETALEILQPCLISEPPISSKLIFETTSIMTKLCKRRKYLFDEQSDDIKIRKEMISIDLTFVRFLQHRFNFGDMEMKTFVDVITSIFPMPATDTKYEEYNVKVRPVLNGFVFNFTLQTSDADNILFFFVDSDCPFSKISRSFIIQRHSSLVAIIRKCSFLLNIDCIPECILFNTNKSENEFSKKNIIVNEFTINKKMKKRIRKEKKHIQSIGEDNDKDHDEAKEANKGEKEKTCHQKSIPFLSDEIIGNLEIKKTIGTGATSTVYKVISKDIQVPNRKYLAHKVLVLDFFKDKKAKKKPFKKWSEEEDSDDDENKEEEEIEFSEADNSKIKNLLNEYEIINKLDHPNIVKAFGFYGGFSGERPPSILLEYFDHTLANSVEDLEDIDLVLIVHEICNVMKYLHEKSIIHRDLKPENILITRTKHVKLCDFGIAKFMDVETQTQTLSMTHQVGTLPYMAPELLEDKGNYDRKVDVYAFGVILYFIIAKERPRISVVNVLAGKKAKIPSSFTKFAKELILMCWSFEPENRPEFKKIIDLIIQNNFMLFNGINEDQINELKEKLELT